SARGRRRRGQDYGTIPSLRPEEAGGEVCPAGAGLAQRVLFQHPNRQENQAFMANTKALSKDERKKSKRAARKKRSTEKPLKPREYARGSQKRKVKKLVRGQAKR